jgi:uncharacterized protein (TIGR03067 family)
MIALVMHAAQADDAAALRGTWKLSSWQTDGKQLSDDHLEGGKLVLDGDRFTVTLAGQETSTGTQKLDATKNPKTIDITADGDPKPGDTCLGIYEIDGDEFRVAFAPPGKPRPTAFTTKPESGQWLHVWTRVKK